MKQRHMTAIAIACGMLCALCVAAFLWSVQGEASAARAEALARYGGEQVEVCVALRDISAGERLDASAVETRLWVADLLPDAPVRESGAAVGRTVTSSILKGEVISEKRFEESRSVLDIPTGLVAVSVPAKAVQAVGGAVRSGMSVDVYSNGSSGTSPIARDVIVLATSVGESGSLVSADSGWITLALDPERVEEVIAASAKTSLYFALPGAQPGAADAASQAAAQPGASAQAAPGASAPAAEAEEGRSGGAASESPADGAETSGAAPAEEGAGSAQEGGE